VNTPGFMLAVLVHEKLLMPLPGKKRSHEAVDPGEFLEKVNSLGSAEAKPKGISRKTPRKTSATTKKKAAIKKKALTKRKTVRGS
jgi:hypothetical protein